MRSFPRRQPIALWRSLLTAAFLVAGPALAQYADVGLSTVRAQRFGRLDLPNSNAGGGDRFAASFAVGDFNGDQVDDLATGVPESDGPTAAPVDRCGEVVVRYGVSGKGLATGAPSVVLGQFVPGSPNGAGVGDRFGSALVACNLNGDAYDDLVVGVPYDSVSISLFDFPEAGIVEVYYGSNAGLTAPASAIRREQSGGMLNFPDSEAHFGFALGCGDFDGDGDDDLAVGLPYRDLDGGPVNAGRINIFLGSPSGLGTGALAFDQNSLNFDDVAEAGDIFGAALAAGDFDGDGFADLAVGVPGESYTPQFGSPTQMGAVQVVYGGAKGLGTAANPLLFEYLFATGNAGDLFGSALAVGDFDSDTYEDLAVGVGNYAFSLNGDEGLVVEIFGALDGLSSTRHEQFTPDSILGDGASAVHEEFGAAVAAGDFDGDGTDDLAAGSPGEFVLGASDGAITVVMGLAGTGLTPGTNRFRQINHGLEGFPGESGEHALKFGDALAAGHFDGDGCADLAIGAPSEAESLLTGVGTETVLYGALLADGFDDGSLGLWSSSLHP